MQDRKFGPGAIQNPALAHQSMHMCKHVCMFTCTYVMSCDVTPCHVIYTHITYTHKHTNKGTPAQALGSGSHQHPAACSRAGMKTPRLITPLGCVATGTATRQRSTSRTAINQIAARAPLSGMSSDLRHGAMLRSHILDLPNLSQPLKIRRITCLDQGSAARSPATWQLAELFGCEDNFAECLENTLCQSKLPTSATHVSH